MDTPIQSKRKAANELVKEVSQTKYQKANKEYQFYIALTMANIELIWCNENIGQDAYTHPIYENITSRSAWMTKYNFIAFYPWRTSKTSNTIVYNTTSSKAGHSAFARRYYVRIVDPNQSTANSRFDVLMECVKVSIILYFITFSNTIHSLQYFNSLF